MEFESKTRRMRRTNSACKWGTIITLCGILFSLTMFFVEEYVTERRFLEQNQMIDALTTRLGAQDEKLSQLEDEVKNLTLIQQESQNFSTTYIESLSKLRQSIKGERIPCKRSSKSTTTCW